MKTHIIIACFLMLSLSETGFTQKTAVFQSPGDIYRFAEELYEKELYSSAYVQYYLVTEMLSDKQSLMYANCRYHMAVCSYQLLSRDAEYKLLEFVEEFSENAYREKAFYYLGNIYYREKKFAKAIEIYRGVDETLLSEKEKDEYHFKYGYSLFVQEDTENAMFQFGKVKDGQSYYAPAATYYYAHIAYVQKNYSTALDHFRKLTEDENFGIVVPYYITQILYFQKKYTELIEYGEPLIAGASAKRLPEIARMVGEAYYFQKKFDKAVIYFEKFRETTTEKLTPEDYYKIGYTYYRLQDYVKAIPLLQNATNGNDTLAQSANYHLGDCFIKTGNKPYARNSFYQAYKMKADPMISEDAMFLFAKLSYELAINPYNEAIKALLDYIREYPDNHRVDEAYEYLVNLYLQTKNYKEALVSLENVKRPTEKMHMAYQKIAFFRGVELFNDRNYKESIVVMNKSMKYPYDKTYRAQALFWKGEAYYRMENLDSALICYNQFMQSPGAYGSEQYSLAYYNIGYCYFNLKQYDKALSSFRTFQEKYPITNDAVAYDACIRLGDCYYVQKRYAEAATSYDMAVKPGVAYADYALFQRGNSKGVEGKYSEKIADLELLMKSYPNSTYFSDVIYELANTYLIVDNELKAIEFYNRIVRDYPNSTYHVKAMKQVGMTYYNMGENEKALVELKKVIQLYQGTPEAKEALVVIRNIYTAMNNVEEFVTYVKGISGETITESEQDTITYVAAENIYFNGDFSAARTGFDKYIRDFPNGTFMLNAQFYRAECDYHLQKYDLALSGYEYVIGKQWSKFTETALMKAAKIYFTKENWSKAAQYYTSLEEKAEFQENILVARMGVMRSYYMDKQYMQAILAAQRVVETPKVNEENINEARSVIGVCAYLVEDFARAQSVFEEQKKLKSEYGAEAFYYLALIQYTIGKYQESEKIIFELINTLPSYDYWIAKAFILLSDNYVATGNLYQAKHTLQSVIDNYQGVDLVQEAQKKMAEIEALETQPDEIIEPQPVE